MNNKSHRWQSPKISVLTAALAAALAACFALSAHALSLGPIVVQSALGEPLRAEIDILEINAEEASSLKTGLASPVAFRAAGLDFNPALNGASISVQRRANGRNFIRVVGDKPVNDPFIDMILEASWSSGRIVRDYTVLLDPPNLRAAAPVAITAPVASASPEPVAPQSAAPATVASARPATAPRAAPANRPQASQKPAAAPKMAADKPAAKAGAAGEKQLTVRPGDNASRIATANKPANVSLDQMLVAMLRNNPDAFVNDNLNRLKSGAVLNMPTAEQALAVANPEARQMVVAQSRDFGDFRKKLASLAPATQVAAGDRQSSGSVQTRVEDKKPVASAPDKLTLSKGSVQAGGATDQLAKDMAAKEAAAKQAELSKNIAELAKLGAATNAASAASGTSSGATKAQTAAASAAVAAVLVPAPIAVPAAVAPAVATAVAQAASAAAPAPAASAPNPKVAKPAPAPVPEPSFIDQLTDNPLLPVAGGGLLALLAGFGFYKSRQRKKEQENDSAFLESRLQPDSFFGSSGGQKVDTNETGAGSSIVYSASQLDAADDVDPVAEADVYLAYGRDQQAEEILKEALKTHAGRLPVHQKLLEIYGKRRDARNFELTANEAFKLTNGEGPDWTRICDQGQGLDPGNQLYLAGGKPGVAVGIPSQPMPLEMREALKAGKPVSAAAVGAAAGAAGLATVAMVGANYNATTGPVDAQPAPAAGVDLDFDLDLDFSLDEENAKVITDLHAPEQTSRMAALDMGPPALDMNFDIPSMAAPLAPAAAPTAPSAAAVDTKPGTIEFDLPMTALSKSGEVSGLTPLEPLMDVPMIEEAEDFKKEAALSFGTTQSGVLSSFAPKAAAVATKEPGLMDFDLGSLSLDLGSPKDTVISPVEGVEEDPLSTKLALAEEFSNFGDTDGARALIEEVLAEATGDLKARAQAALAKLA